MLTSFSTLYISAACDDVLVSAPRGAIFFDVSESSNNMVKLYYHYNINHAQIIAYNFRLIAENTTTSDLQKFRYIGKFNDNGIMIFVYWQVVP